MPLVAPKKSVPQERSEIVEYWVEFRSVYFVAKYRSISKASEALEIHRATVMRHVDALENHLGFALFHRHHKGCTPTDSGESFLAVGERVLSEYRTLFDSLRNGKTSVTGEISVSSPLGLSTMVVKAAELFRQEHEYCNVRHEIVDGVPKLELADVNLSVCAGPKPTTPDYVVVPLLNVQNALYAHKCYLERVDLPTTEETLGRHKFALVDELGMSEPNSWLRALLSSLKSQHWSISYSSTNHLSVFRAVFEGIGVGVLPIFIAENNDQLIQIAPNLAVPPVPVWSVTHGNTHRTPKTQAFIKYLRLLGARMETEPALLREIVSVT
ncbi:MAG: LysR family transcriptional regulator [Pseudomonadota bacterium]